MRKSIFAGALVAALAFFGAPAASAQQIDTISSNFAGSTWGMAIDPDGNLYVAEANGNTLWFIQNISGTYQPRVEIAPNSFGAPCSILRLPNGDLLVGDGNQVTRVFAPDYTATGQFARPDGAKPYCGLALDSAGNVFVSTGLNIYRYDAADNYAAANLIYQNPDVDTLNGLAINSSDNLIVAGRFKVIELFAADGYDGNTAKEINNGSIGLIRNIGIDSNGHLYLADEGNVGLPFFAAPDYGTNQTIAAATLPVVVGVVVDSADNIFIGTSDGKISRIAALPMITGLSPSAGPEAGNNNLDITVTGKHFGVPADSLGIKINGILTSSTQDSDTQQRFFGLPAGTGTVNVEVTNQILGSSPAVRASQFTYFAVPTVTGIVPISGPGNGGDVVTITGTNLTGATAVKFGANNAASFTVDSATQITATSPAGLGLGAVDVTVTTPGGTTATSPADVYNYNNPIITNVSPTQGPIAGGNTITLTGTRLASVTGITMGGCDATPSISNNTTTLLMFTSTGCNPYTPDITVTTAEGSATISNAYTYVKFPHVTGISPSAGVAGTVVTITGSFLDESPTVKFGTTAASSVVVNAVDEIQATAPAHAAGAVNVTVTTPGGTSTETNTFTYADVPAVTSISPKGGPLAGNTTVTITGTNLASATHVKFGAVDGTVTANSATSITVKSPAHALGTVDITVTTAGGTSAIVAADKYTYANAPTITAINPNQGPANGGTPVAIVGTNLTGASAVKFGTTAAASFSVQNATHATAMAPVHAVGAVNVSITTPGGTSAAANGNKFTYTKTPVISTIAKFVGGKTDGSKPVGGLVSDAAGALYGTTSQGGASGLGTVFKLTPAGAGFTKTILHHFNGTDGATPFAGLVIDSAKNLYGVTTAGGNKNKGVLFKLTGTTYKVLYNFQGTAADGGVPYATLARDATGLLYGATTTGGSKGKGTTFTFKEPSTFKATHHFAAGTDGNNPQGAILLDATKNVYGTTTMGGTPNRGTAFKIAPNGTSTILHSFAIANTDGHEPRGGLFKVGNMLIGTTYSGGTQNKGAVFEVMPPSTADTLLFSFTGATGANPYAGVIGDTAGILYGTTFNGGATNLGVVFKLLPPVNGQAAWSQSVMYAFKGGATEGASPAAPVLLGKTAGTLFGTTNGGGSAACAGGCGTVFKVVY